MRDYKIKLRNDKIRALQAENRPLFFMWSIILLAILLLQLGVPSAEGQTQGVVADVRCPKTFLNGELLRKVLERQIQLGIDQDTYSDVRVRVKRLRLGQRMKNRQLVNGSDILSGLTISYSGHTPSLTGSVSYIPTCDYSVVARVITKVTEIATGARLTSKSTSTFTITSSGDAINRQVSITDDSEDTEDS